jgi:hypothetical protein
MRRVLLAFALVIIGLYSVHAQNLVGNYSFETNSGCPGGPCEWQRATGWNNLNMLTGCGAYGTPDYFHTCGGGFSHLPYNGYLTVNPHTGNAVMGFLTWSGSLSPNFREMVSRQLSSPMVVGQTYTVSFWICNGYTPYYGGGSNHIGLDFSTTPLSQGGGMPNLVLLTPEYEIPGVFFSNAWVQYTFNITATAPWQYITFGNFYNDASTTAVIYYASAPYFRCYYFIDDISITTSVILPLKLEAPAVAATQTGSRIEWQATAEEGITKYEVERSRIADAGFEVVAQTAQTGQGNYSLPDNAIPSPGTWYYRVKASDATGQIVTSETATFEFDPGFPLISTVFPSPTRPGVPTQLQAWLPKSAMVRLDLMDLQGRQLFTTSQKCDAGENAWTLPSDQLAKGTYLVRISCPSGTASTKFIVGG